MDPFEGADRKKLNFGHTIGHAIESLSLERGIKLLHGEAVAIGMIIETWLSLENLQLPKNEANVIIEFLQNNFPLTALQNEDFMPLLNLMQADKKNHNLSINFSLLKEIGSCKINVELSEDSIEKALIWFSKLM